MYSLLFVFFVSLLIPFNSSYSQMIPFAFFRSQVVAADSCDGSASPGDVCTGGAIHLGTLSPGATSGSGTDYYMTTPGGCTDSATPTCDNTTDTLTKTWHGSGGSNAGIAGLPYYTTTVGTGNGATNTDANYGSANTAVIIAHASISSDSAADWCNDLNYGGYTDWHLPNRYELNLMFTNKASIPGLDVTGQFYWSSTAYFYDEVWRLRFSDGLQTAAPKFISYRVRCVRKYDPCESVSPSPGAVCAGGTIYLGSLSPGATGGAGTDKYMTTPGGCTDSATPTCDNTTDTLTKTWRGSSGSNVDIPGLTNYTTTSGTGHGATNTDADYGSANTAVIVAHASISSDSAADWCNDLDYGGYTDWHLPNRYEFNLMFTNKASIPGLDVTGSWYWSSTEFHNFIAWVQRFSNGEQANTSKSISYRVRCVRRFFSAGEDILPEPIQWADFDNESLTQTFAGIDTGITVEISATNETGTPTLEYNKNASGWTVFTTITPASVGIVDGDTLQLRVSGTAGHSADFRVRNTSDGNATLDYSTIGTVVAVDPCDGTPSPGDVCTGGAIYLGSLSPGATGGAGTDKYMTTPGDCTDSATPTCDNTTDTLTKIWRGSAGSSVDNPGLTNYTTTMGAGNGAINTDADYGSANTSVIIAHASISSDSAADWCNDLDYGGYTDWHLPNRYELNLMFTNKASIPGLDVSGEWYWSSTEYNGTNAWRQRFSDGYQGSTVKGNSYRIRCVRRF